MKMMAISGLIATCLAGTAGAHETENLTADESAMVRAAFINATEVKASNTDQLTQKRLVSVAAAYDSLSTGTLSDRIVLARN